MAAEKISALAALGTAPAAADLLVMVDISDTSMAPTGTTKNMTIDNIKAYMISGTNNTLTKFTGTNTIGDSAWAFSGNNLVPDVTGYNLGRASNRVGTGFINTLDYATDLIFSQNGTERGRFLAGGNFGINTGAPGALLDVFGTGTTSLTLNARFRNNAGAVALAISDERNVGIGANPLGFTKLYLQSLNVDYAFAIANESFGVGISSSFKMYMGGTGETYFGAPGSDNSLILYANSRFGVNTVVGGAAATFHVKGQAATNIVKFNNASISNAMTIDVTGITTWGSVPVGNAGLTTGQMYQDTAANVLANGDNVLALKV